MCVIKCKGCKCCNNNYYPVTELPSNRCNKARHKCSDRILVWLQTVFTYEAHFTQLFVEFHCTGFQKPEIWQNFQMLRLDHVLLRRDAAVGAWMTVSGTAFWLVHAGPHEPCGSHHHFPECSEPLTSQKVLQSTTSSSSVMRMRHPFSSLTLVMTEEYPT